MGGILELVEGLKTPVGIVVAVVVVAAIYFYYKWLMKD